MDLLEILEKVKNGELTPLEAQSKILSPGELPEDMPHVEWFKAWKIDRNLVMGEGGYPSEEACLRECNETQYAVPIYLT